MLSGLSRVYGSIISYRNSLYERGKIASKSLGAPTISVGNLTVGGTGKTPLVLLIAEILAERGERVAIISRGYRRKNPKDNVLVSDWSRVLVEAEIAGDEPFELANRLLGKAIIVADGDRARGAESVRMNYGVTAFILDDGFQHRRATRNLDIVVIDSTNAFGNYDTLPNGILREPIENLSRADLLILSRADLVSEIDSTISEVRKFNSNAPLLLAENYLESIYDIFTGEVVNIERFRREKKLFLFSGVGNPDALHKQIDKEGFVVAASKKFRDHHAYSQQNVRAIEQAAREANANVLITTPKDAVKLRNLRFELPCFVIESRVRVSDRQRLESIIGSIL